MAMLSFGLGSHLQGVSKAQHLLINFLPALNACPLMFFYCYHLDMQEVHARDSFRCYFTNKINYALLNTRIC